MWRLLLVLCAFVACLSASASPLLAAGANSYQVTGPVLDVSDSTIAVQKGKDRWEIARDSATKIEGDLKVGSKVTIQYRMIATSIEVKPEKGSKRAQ
jgi:hypothetical protein